VEIPIKTKKKPIADKHSQILEHHVGDSTANPEKQLEEPVIGVSLRPRDPLSKKLVSSAIETRNVLVRVSLPKRTGRKRKRGSDQPFTHHPNDTNIGHIDDNTSSSNSSIRALDFLRRLKDNPTNYTIQPIGTINETHRFRNLPDFQMIASENAMMRELAVHARPNYQALKTLAIDMRPGASHIESFVAPPSFMAANMPYRYEFNQASGVKFGQDESGNAITTNIQAPPRRVVVAVEPDVEQVPQAPPASLERHHQFGHYLDDAIRALGELLEKRPLLTRRVAMNFIPQYSDSVFKEATQWVGYSFRAGPWRDSLIKYGVDPRKDPKYRIYQTLMFQLDKRSEAAAAPPPAGNPDDSIPITTNPPSTWQNHIFDGHHIRPGGGKTWQICDVTDPLLKSLFQTPSIQTECDVHQFGWYYNGTLCKARAIMRDKMDHLFRGATPPEAEYEKIARMPDRITRDKLAETYLEDAEAGSRSNVLAIDVRSMARLGEKNREIRARERRVRAAMERAAERGVEYDDEEGEKEEDEEMGAIDPALLDAGESMRGDLEADDEEEDEDADADLEAAGDLQDDDEAEGDEKHQQDGEE
jgi:general transcription factor 3C polypeptide 5 (transcription factor C subunit 1)